MVIDPSALPTTEIRWIGARRIVRHLYPPIPLFEDIADPADWELLVSAAQKTDSQLAATIGAIDLVPPARRVFGEGATFLMAPFTHVSPDRPSRFTRGRYGVLYVARDFQTAVLETMYHHARFMARTNEEPGWTGQFLELILDVRAVLHDLRGGSPAVAPALDPVDYAPAQDLGEILRDHGSEGALYPSLRDPQGECVGLFYPDLASIPVQGRKLAYRWDGRKVDAYQDRSDGADGAVFQLAKAD